LACVSLEPRGLPVCNRVCRSPLLRRGSEDCARGVCLCLAIANSSKAPCFAADRQERAWLSLSALADLNSFTDTRVEPNRATRRSRGKPRLRSSDAPDPLQAARSIRGHPHPLDSNSCAILGPGLWRRTCAGRSATLEAEPGGLERRERAAPQRRGRAINGVSPEADVPAGDREGSGRLSLRLMQRQSGGSVEGGLPQERPRFLRTALEKHERKAGLRPRPAAQGYRMGSRIARRNCFEGARIQPWGSRCKNETALTADGKTWPMKPSLPSKRPGLLWRVCGTARKRRLVLFNLCEISVAPSGL